MSLAQEQARQKIRQLIEKYRSLSDHDRKSLSETNVVSQFITPLLEALGWPIQDPQRFKYELNLAGGKPDITLLPEQGGTLFVEAKRFGVIAELKEARQTVTGIVTPCQLALPGMAVDRTPQEQQAINYAFQNGGSWAILTNFEVLRLFNARRDWLVLSFDKPSALLSEFDLLWQLSYEQILSGGLETLSNQRHREDVDTDYLNFINTYRELLAQDIVKNKAQNPWAFDENGAIRLAELRSVVQRFLDRLVIVRFAEDHLVVPPGTLQQFYELRRSNPYSMPLHLQFSHFFRVFDQKHNSALFAPDLADQVVISDEVLLPLTAKLYEARYRAMPADIMGNTYEQYLGKALVQVGGQVLTRDNLETRKKQGSYYTPQVIVRYLVDNSLGRYLYGTANGQANGEALPDERRKEADEIRALRVIDPACGSGSFLIYAYEVLANFYRSEITRLEAERSAKIQELAKAGKTTPFELELQTAGYTAQLERLKYYPRIILETHLYGVDLDPQAAEIATVNLMMRAIADMPQMERRLPLILNQNVKVGNALIGAGASDPRYNDHLAPLQTLRQLRLKLVAEGNGSSHEAELAEIAEISGTLNATLNQSLTATLSDPASHRPFNWLVEFPEVFLGDDGQLTIDDGRKSGGQRSGTEAESVTHNSQSTICNSGFTIIIGNPPWEIVKPDLREYYAQFDAKIESKLTREQVEKRIAELNAADPTLKAGFDAQSERIAESATFYSKSSDYTRQGGGDRATHKLFVERAYQLLADEGRLGFLIPSGIYTDLGTKPLREMLLNEGRIEYLFSFSNERFFFPDVHHSFKFTLLGVQKGAKSDGFWAAFRFNPRVAVAPNDLPTFLADPANLVFVRLDALAKFSPDSLSVMEFQSQKDADIAESLYLSAPILGDASVQGWKIRFHNEFHFTNDRHLLNQLGNGYPLYEGKTFNQFDAFYGVHHFWVDESNSQISAQLRQQLASYRVVHRRIARSTDAHTLISAIVPSNTACEVNATVVLIENGEESTKPFVCALLNSLVLDYLIRFKVSTTLNMFYMYSLPVPRLTAGNPYFDAIVPRAARLTCVRAEFADLWQEVMGEPWDASKGATDPAERQQLRDELDAIIAHLYALSRDDFEHILGSFPLVFPDDANGQAKKAALLRVYDKFGREKFS